MSTSTNGGRIASETATCAIAHRELVWQPCSPREFESADLVIVEHANRLLLNYRLLAARGEGRRVAFWGHGANFQAPAEHAGKDGLKRNLARTADWWFAYTNGGARLVESYGYPRDRVTVVNNSIDSRGIADAIARLSDEKSRLRARLRSCGRPRRGVLRPPGRREEARSVVGRGARDHGRDARISACW